MSNVIKKRLIKFIVLCGFVIKTQFVYSQTIAFPVIINSGQRVTDFIPSGWIIRDSVSGDLNNDKINDYVIVIEKKEAIGAFIRENAQVKKLKSHPRILIVLFQDKLTKWLKLAEQNNEFIFSRIDSSEADPFQNMQIKNKILTINFLVYYGPSAYDNLSYSFRYQQGDFSLIGANKKYYNEATRDGSDYSYNFLTKKWSIIETVEDQNKPAKKNWHVLKIKKIKTLKTVKLPNTWEVTKGNYL